VHLSGNCEHDILKNKWQISTKLISTMQYETEMNVSHFGVKGQGRGGIKYAGNSTFMAC